MAQLIVNCNSRNSIMDFIQHWFLIPLLIEPKCFFPFLRYELRIRYLPKGYLSHFSEDKPSLNYLYHQVRHEEAILDFCAHFIFFKATL